MIGNKSIIMLNIRYHFQSSGILRQRRRLSTFISKKLLEAGYNKGSVDIIFVTDQELLSINQQFLKHDYYTDIITFNLSDSFNPLMVELYISYERVKDNAHNQHTTLSKELHRVIFHGILHVLKFNDKTTKQQLEMRNQENIWLNEYFNES